ncbi:MAG: hypothetical protein KatS3mg008_0485 [Acidimicrobiales bacterium]|nr:MAG: hypothetical protein KatS3mg008_0485 [Acidimicrobiales bacterium]
MSGPLEDLRREIAHVCHVLAERGLVVSTAGNVSARRDSLVAVTPTGASLDDVEPRMITVVDLEGNVVWGDFEPTSETALHLAVYANTPASAVVHMHSPAATAVSCLTDCLPAVHYSILELGGPVRVAEYATFGTPELAANTVAALESRTAALMQNHGAVTWGDSLDKATERAFLLEWLCELWLRCRGVGEPRILGKEELDDVVRVAIERSYGTVRVRPRTDATPADHEKTTGSAHGDPRAAILPEGWPDAVGLIEQCRRLATSTPRRVTRDLWQSCMDWFEERCSGSRRDAEEASDYIPGGVQHNLALNKPFPLHVVKAEGAYLWDVDGNRYVDFLQAGGPTVLGSNDPVVREKVIATLRDTGPSTGLLHRSEIELAKLVSDFVPSVRSFRMLGSGTEAVMAAIRAARAFTGKRHVVKIGGAYHGWSDQMLVGLRIPGTGTLEATGVPPGCLETTREVFPNDVDALAEVLDRNESDGGTAAVLLEPVGPESGTWPAAEKFAADVRELCDRHDTLLVFDEVVTGFRLGMGGAQALLGVTPDLTVFGKCIAGGYPGAGAVGGRADVMACFAGGISAAGRRALIGGTLAATPLSCVAGYHALVEMAERDAPAAAARAGLRLRRGLERIIEKWDLPFVTYSFGSIVHLHTTGLLHLDLGRADVLEQVALRKDLLEEYSAAFAAHGIVTLAGSRLYTSMADTDEVIDAALAAFERVLSSTEEVPS